MQPRTGIGVSLLLHALAVLGLSRVALNPPRIATEPIASVVWLTLPQPTPQSSEPPASLPSPTTPPPDDARRRERASDKTPATRETPRPTERTPPERAVAPPAPAQEPERTIDFDESRRRAAAEVVTAQDPADSRRSFTFPGTIAEQRAFDEDERLRRVERGLQAPLTAFDSPSKGRAGLTAHTALDSLAWVSDDCYRLADTSGHVWLPGFMLPATICLKRHPRADLFAAVKPSYLMDTDEHRAADAEAQRRERLRRPTTGAVMPLGKD
jgi:hypothetical protein